MPTQGQATSAFRQSMTDANQFGLERQAQRLQDYSQIALIVGQLLLIAETRPGMQAFTGPGEQLKNLLDNHIKATIDSVDEETEYARKLQDLTNLTVPATLTEAAPARTSSQTESHETQGRKLAMLNTGLGNTPTNTPTVNDPGTPLPSNDSSRVRHLGSSLVGSTDTRSTHLGPIDESATDAVPASDTVPPTQQELLRRSPLKDFGD
ncbi:hypothetical protein BKA93DRAFT_750154 [Sparassis latifolia]